MAKRKNPFKINPAGVKRTLRTIPKTFDTLGPILKITGHGKPVAGKLPVRVAIPRPARKKPILRVLTPQPGKKPGTVKAKPIQINPEFRPTRRKPKPRWRQSIPKPNGFSFPSESALPPGVEAFIDISEDNKGLYRLNIATHEEHTTTTDHEVVDLPGQHCVCHHPKNASSWVAAIGLVVLERGELGLYAKFWDGGEIAYVWPNSDDVIWFYNDWKAARSKGKYIRGREGPSILWSQPYVRLN